ncbi:1807_t:CDS:2 [Entrophospora sp. SA101]|nr:4249_t:CDS:2 [Entrophospora sp. SA101]CAJ0834915.1 1807_t:CDS:2 [Entrophospora sp. SA101]
MANLHEKIIKDTSLEDEAIRETNDDAATSKLSAVNVGYLNDKFVKYFVRRTTRRPPIINRGTYVRNVALDTLIKKFLEGSGGKKKDKHDMKKQIVSLGAGSDTRYFHFKKSQIRFHKYFEIDYPQVNLKKIMSIRRHEELLELLGNEIEIGKGETEIYGIDYCLLSGDLRNFESDLIPIMESKGFDRSLPTLFLSECVMIYMDPTDSDKLVEWIGKNMRLAIFIVYEQILPDDAFGSVMLHNLRLRNIELRGIHAYPTLQSQKDRYLSRGWNYAEAIDINEIHDYHLDPNELSRISRLELMDEFEEWKLLAKHYCIAWAYKVTTDDKSHKSFFDNIKFDDFHKKPNKEKFPKISGPSLGNDKIPDHMWHQCPNAIKIELLVGTEEYITSPDSQTQFELS